MAMDSSPSEISNMNTLTDAAAESTASQKSNDEVDSVRTNERYRAIQLATWVGVIVNIILSVGKCIAGVFGHSAALIADGIHSASDLVTDFIVLISAKYGQRDADENYPYGHGKFETLATLFIAVFLMAVAIGIAASAARSVFDPDLHKPGMITLILAIISVVSKEWLYHFTVRIGRKVNASVLIANAWHHRSDAISSVAALFGIACAMAGWTFMDPIAAIVVALILGKVSIELLVDAVKELSDTTNAVNQETKEKIASVIKNIPGVLEVSSIRPRQVGPNIVVDASIVVDLFLTVSEGHQVAEQVQRSLITEVDDVSFVTVHVRPHNSKTSEIVGMATRNEIRAIIEKAIKNYKAIKEVGGISAHYSPEGIVVEAILTANDDFEFAQVQAEAREVCAKVIKDDNGIVSMRTNLTLAEHGESRATRLEVKCA